jgi:hypothetical protein
VEQRPPEPESAGRDPRDLGDEVEIDLTGAGQSRRWRIELELTDAKLPFRWEGDRLHTVEAAAQVLDHERLLDFDEPDDDLEPTSTPLQRFEPPPLRVNATDVWLALADPTLGPWVRWLLIVLGLVVAAALASVLR